MDTRKQKKTTFRDRQEADESLPPFVRGYNATPKALGNDDDVSWAIAQELERFFYEEGIITGKNAAWLFKAGQFALDKSRVRKEYSRHPKRFRDGDGKQMTLAEFGRKIVLYFRRNASWQYASGPEDLIGMFYDPVMLDSCARGLWRVYSDRRIQRGVK